MSHERVYGTESARPADHGAGAEKTSYGESEEQTPGMTEAAKQKTWETTQAAKEKAEQAKEASWEKTEAAKEKAMETKDSAGNILQQAGEKVKETLESAKQAVMGGPGEDRRDDPRTRGDNLGQ